MVKLQTSARVLNATLLGEEPKFDGESDRAALVRAFNWYSYSNTITDSKKWILVWMQANGYTPTMIGRYKASDSSTITQTKASISRMLTCGLVDARLEKHLRDHLDNIIKTPTVKVKVEKKPIPITPEIPNPLIADIDDMLDVLYLSKYKIPEDANEQIVAVCKDRPQGKCKEALALYVAIRAEVDLGEGYESTKKAYRKRYIKFLDMITTELAKYLAVSKTRKPRKKKPKSQMHAKIASKLRYLKHHELASSVDPTQLFDTKMILLYNPTTRKLSKYVTGSDKMSIKGQTIINFDEKRSFVINIRKPEEAIPILISKLISTGNSYIARQTAVKQPVTGRITDKMLLLRVQR
jgi:hypothetical protein